MTKAGKTSRKRDNDSDVRERKGVDPEILPPDTGFSDRLRDALGGRAPATVARAVGIPSSSIDRYLNGAKPPADRALLLAIELGVRPEWLILGANGRGGGALNSDDCVNLPRYDLTGFTNQTKPAQVETIIFRKEFLGRWADTPGLWLAEMPSEAAPGIAREGNFLLCVDPELTLVDGRVYAFLLGGQLIVRRAQVRPEGIMLKTSPADPDPIVIAPDRATGLLPIARLLAAISLKPL